MLLITVFARGVSEEQKYGFPGLVVSDSTTEGEGGEVHGRDSL